MPEDITEVSLLVLYVVTGAYALEDIAHLMDKEERLMARGLSSSARGIEVCVWELRRRHPRYTRPEKLRTAFTHNHERRIAPKGSWKQPYLHRGWDVETFLGEGDKDPRWLAHPRKEVTCRKTCGCWNKMVKQFGDMYGSRELSEEAHIAEELMHARELADMEAISDDELDLVWADEEGRAWEAEQDWWASCDRLEELAEQEAAEADFITYAELMQAPTEPMHDPASEFGWGFVLS